MTRLRAEDVEHIPQSLQDYDQTLLPKTGYSLSGIPPAQGCAEAACVADGSPIDDFRGSADYRNHLVEVLTRRALTRALAHAQGGAA